MLRIVISQHVRYSFEANEKSRLGEEGKILYGNLMWGWKRPTLQTGRWPWQRWLAQRLQRLDARRFLVVHDEEAVVQLCDAGVGLAQQLESLPAWRDRDAFLDASVRILPPRFRNSK